MKAFPDSCKGGLYLNWQGVSCLLDWEGPLPAILVCPELELILVEVVRKKVFLQEVIQQLKLQNVWRSIPERWIWAGTGLKGNMMR